MTQLDMYRKKAPGLTLDEALAQVRVHANPDVVRAIMEAIRWVCEEVTEFSTDAVWSRLDERGILVAEPRVLGALMREAAAFGWCYATDRFVSSERLICHRRPVRVWRSRR